MTNAQLHHVWWIVPSPSHHNSAHAVIIQSLEAIPDLKVSIVLHRAAETQCRGFFARQHPHLVPRLHFIPYGSPDIPPKPENWGILVKECLETAQPTLDRVQDPTRFILSMFMADKLAPAVRAKWTGVEVYMHWSSCAGWLYNVLRPSPDGAGDYKAVMAKLQDDRQFTPQEQQMLLAKIIFAANGTTELNDHVVELPGLPPMYNYELHSDKVNTPPPLAFMVKAAIDGAALVDGITLNTSQHLEGDMLKALSTYINTSSMGFQVDSRAWTGRAFLADGPVKEFLDSHNGHKGVLLISFGTLYTPTEYVEEFIDVLVGSDQPFLLVAPSPALLAPTLAAKIVACPHGMFQSSLIDQIAVLSHPATKWFLTHGGWTSIQESLVLGVPPIVWPLANSDQPYNAALLSTRDKPLGIELLQTRTGPSARKAMRGVEIKGTADGFEEEFKAVLEDLHGKKGEEIRRNVDDFSARVKEEHQSSAEVIRGWAGVAK